MQDKKQFAAVAMGKTEQRIKDLKLKNITTLFDVTAESEAQFIAKVVNAHSGEQGGQETELSEQAKTLYQQAKIEVNHQQAAKRATQLRNDPVLHSINKLAFPVLPSTLQPQARTDLSLTSEIPEREKLYVDPASIQSMFSPARYLCELYNVAQELHAPENKLHIDLRRPDIKALTLSNNNMQREVSSLDILLDVLQKKVTPAALTEDTKTQANNASFTLPYDDNLTVINTVLQDKSISLREIATLLTDNDEPWENIMTPALMQEQLGLNAASSALIKIASDMDDSSVQRLAHATQLDIEQLKWLNKNIITNSNENDKKKLEVLAIIAEYRRLNQHYGLSVDQYVAIINDINIHAKDNETSFFQQTFSPLTTDITLNFIDQKENETILRNKLGITAEELRRIAKYCFGEQSNNVEMNTHKFSQLYRMAFIPYLLGLCFSQAEYLWKLNDKLDSGVMEKIATSNALFIVNSIDLLEKNVQWMSEKKLDIAALQAMTTTQYSTAATPELFNFLSNIYQTLGKQVYSDSLKPNLYRSLGAGFHLKSNIVEKLVDWLERNDTDFRLEDLWNNISMIFIEAPSLHQLEVHQPLIIQCHKLSQYVLIAQWAELTDQEITFILSDEYFDNRAHSSSPDLALLQFLSEFKFWQKNIKTSLSNVLAHIKNSNIDQDERVKNLRSAAEVTRSVANNTLNEVKEEIYSSNEVIHNLESRYNRFEKLGASLYKIVLLDATKRINICKEKIAASEEKKKQAEDSIVKADKNIIEHIKKYEYEYQIETIAKIHDWDLELTKNTIKHIFNDKFDHDLKSIILLVNCMSIIKKLNISSECLSKIRSFSLNRNVENSNNIKFIANELFADI
ncbi:Tc toxin subunit A [Yersinia sp. Marseille-Q3913]|uniref:Tc toxin subunit A n=1 Tax=Yersinia sp. Marseille-Q3913 TaxID=2830769 RepID=UPI001BAE8A5F|nr:Tc toxin subunit A [Yersinia sp. Marseille-Q3913]MBS0054147.1 toxin [Yersinia sp. Marseille-Q3913]